MVPEKLRVFIDPGNRSTLFRVENLATGEVTEDQWKSIVAFPGYEEPHVAIAPGSAYLDFTAGSAATAWGGQTIAVGEGATDFEGALPVFKLDTSNGAGKIYSSLFFVIGALSQTSSTSFEIVELVVMHPDPSPEVLKAYTAALVGHHHVVRNGVAMDVLIKPDTVVLLPEGVCGYYEAVGQGVLNPAEINAFFDIGGLSAIVGLVNRRGPMPGARINSPRGGVHRLARIIGQKMKSAGLFPGGTFDTGLILDGLFEGTGSKLAKGTRYPYGSREADSPLFFDEFVAGAKKMWAFELAALYAEVAGGWSASRAKTLALGGGSYYFAPAIAALNSTGDYNFVKLEAPEKANIQGAVRLMNESFLAQISMPKKTVELSGKARQVPHFALV